MKMHLKLQTDVLQNKCRPKLTVFVSFNNNKTYFKIKCQCDKISYIYLTVRMTNTFKSFFFWCHKPRHSNNCYLDLPLTCTPTTNNNGQCSVNLWRHCTMLNCCVICRAFRKCWALRFAWFLHVTIPFGFTPVPAWWTHNGLLVSLLNSRLCGPASGRAWGCYVVFLGQDIFTIIVSLHPSV